MCLCTSEWLANNEFHFRETEYLCVMIVLKYNFMAFESEQFETYHNITKNITGFICSKVFYWAVRLVKQTRKTSTLNKSKKSPFLKKELI